MIKCRGGATSAFILASAFVILIQALKNSNGKAVALLRAGTGRGIIIKPGGNPLPRLRTPEHSQSSWIVRKYLRRDFTYKRWKHSIKNISLSSSLRSTKSDSSRSSSSVSGPSMEQDDSAASPEIPINPLLSSIEISKTVEIFSLVKQMESNGEHITSLCVGEPDFLPPQAARDAAIQAIQHGQTTYTAVTGTSELRTAIANDLKHRKNVIYNPITEIIVGNGAKQCIYQGMLSVIQRSDEVIIPSPYWPSYPEITKLIGGHPVILETKQADGYLLNPKDLRRTLGDHPNAKLLILCNPSNPTGGVHDKTLLMELSSVLQDFPKVTILADEIYERLMYTSAGHTAFASIPGMHHRTITINGFSKAYAMTGMRLGYLAAPAHIVKACTTIQSQFTSCAGSISQAAGVAALTKVDESEMQGNVDIMKKKRDYVLSELSKMRGVTVDVPPMGAFYVLPNIMGYCKTNGADDAAFCIELLNSKKLALVPGSAFGAAGTVRISYATSFEELQVAMAKLNEFLQEQSIE